MNTLFYKIRALFIAFFRATRSKKKEVWQPVKAIIQPNELAERPIELKADTSMIHKNRISTRTQVSSIQDTDIDGLIAWSQSYNGYARQDCVLRLTGVFEEKVFPVILLRLNDYVPQVRQAAENSFRLWLKEENLYLFLEYFLDIVALEARSRISAQILEEIASYLESGKTDMQKIMECEQGKRSKALFDWAVKYQWFDVEELHQISKNSVNPLIRRYWVGILKTTHHTQDLMDSINSRYKDVQYAAFQLIVNSHDVTVWQDIALKLLISKNIGLRNLAVFYLKINNFDLPSFLFTQLQATQHQIEILRYFAVAEYLKVNTLAPIAVELLKTDSLKLQFGAVQYLMAVENLDHTEMFLLGLENHPNISLYTSNIIKVMKQWGKERLTLEKAILIIGKLNLGFESNYKIAQILYLWDRLALSLYLFSTSSNVEMFKPSIREKLSFILIQELGQPQISLFGLTQNNLSLLKDALRSMSVEDSGFEQIEAIILKLVNMKVLNAADIPLSLKGANFL